VSDRALGWVEAAIAFPSFADRGEFDRFSCSSGGFWVVWSIVTDHALKLHDC
jgi:hypothetical protein